MKKIAGAFFLLLLLAQTIRAQAPIELAAWNTATSFAIPRGSHSGVAYNGYLYVLGGTADDVTRFNDVQFAPINADGSLGAWQSTTSFNTGRRSHASVAYNGYLYVLGGAPTGGGVLNDVQYAPINADGSLGAWQYATSFSPGRLAFSSVAYNGYLYVIQGFYYSAASPLTDVQYAPINADGSLGAWQSTTSFSPARYGNTSVACAGRIYTLGGSGWNGSYYTLGDVKYTAINANGSLDSWQNSTTLNPSLVAHGLAEHDGHLILTGGLNIPSGVLEDVKYAEVNADGSLGTWQELTSLSAARHSHASVASNGYLYVMGGNDSDGNVLNDVQYAKIMPLPTISGTLTCSGSFLAGVVMNGLPGNPASDSSGNYTAIVNNGWSGTVTPTLTGYAFSPGNRVYSAVTADHDAQDYSAVLLPSYSISGTVTSGASALAGVVLDGLPGNPVTDESGFYSADVFFGWSGTVTPTLAGHVFDPATRTYTSVSFSRTGQNYAAAPLTYSISGTVSAYGFALAGVTLSGLPGEPVTDASGNYSATVNYGFTGTATPTLDGYAFTPDHADYANVTDNATGQDYAAVSTSALPTLEREALIALYNSTNGDGWTDNSGWKTPPLHTDGFSMPGTEGIWFGITVENSHAKKITLFNNNLTGVLPTQIGNLTSVSELILGMNALSGNIPGEIGDMSNLWIINLSDNQFVESIPIEIGNLTNLAGLSIENNQLAGNIPAEIGNLTNLDRLFLGYNQLTGSIPTEITNITGLRQLDLRSNQLSGEIPAQIGSLTDLEWLFLYNNQLSGSIPVEIGNLTKLVYLGISDNQFSGIIPSQLSNLVQLTSLELAGNRFSGSIPSEVANLVNLESADIGYNALFSNDSDLITFLELKDPDWAATQTIAPGNMAATPVNSTTINLTWDAIPYTGDTGGSRIFVGTTSGGPYTFFQQTSDKTITSMPVTGLNPGTPYYFVIQTRTDTHDNNQNVVESEYSSEPTATTIPAYTVTFIAGSGGTLSGETTQVVEHGSSCTPVTAEPSIGYHFVDWTGDYSGTENPLTVTNVIADMTVTANFAVNQYTVTFIEGAGGTITGTKVQTVNHGDSTSEVTAVPNTGYSFVNWTGDHTGTANPLTIANVTTGMTVTANFTLSSLAISGTILIDSSPLAGVVMSGLPGNPATNGSGFYTSTVDYDWSGTVTPTLAGYAFTPASRTYANIASDQTSQDYAAAPAPSLQLTTPNGWEHWTLGTTKAITWNAVNYTGTVRLVLFKNGVRFGNIAANIPAAAGSYAWTVGQTLDSGMAPKGSDYRLYLRSTDNTIVDPSDYRLGLIEPAQLEMTSPNGGESWELGTTQNITWNANGYAGTVRLILFQKAGKVGQIVGSLPADQGSYAWTVGTHQAGTALAGINYSIRLLAGDGSQEDFSDGPLTLIENEALIVNHQHTALDAIPGEWLEQASRHKLLVLSALGNDPVTLGLRLLGNSDVRLAIAQTATAMGLAVNEGSWLPQGAALDAMEWRWALEKAILESQATVAVIRPDEGALLTGRLNAEGYLATLAELAARLPDIKLVCATVGMDEPDDILSKFNRQVRESVLRNRGMLLDAADIESWSGGEQTLVKEIPVRHPAKRMSQGMQSQGNLASQGSAAWWLLARLSGWKG